MKKDISTIATEIGISKSAIHKRIKKEPLKSVIQPYISVVGNKVLIDIHGETILKDTFTKTSTNFHEIHDTGNEIRNIEDENGNAIHEVNENADENNKNGNEIHVSYDGTEKTSTNNIVNDNEIIKLLQQNISVLQQQLEIKDKQIENKDRQIETKDKQIEELTTAVKLQAESISNDRKNELAETIIDGKDKLIEGTNRNSRGFLRNLFKGKKKDN